MYFELIGSDVMQEPLNHLIGGVLPTENYEPDYFVEILQGIDKYIKLEEFSGAYYALMAILKQLEKLAVSNLKYDPIVARESVELALQSNIYSLIRNENVRMYDLLSINGYETNLDIETNVEPAARLLFKTTIELYDTCFNLKQKSSEALSYLPALKEAAIINVAVQSVQVQSRILSSEFKIGRKIYAGPQGWLEFNRETNTELENRISEVDNNGVIRLDNLDLAISRLGELNEMFVPLSKYGLPPMDTATPMLRHRLVVICANENVGKTMFATECAGNLLADGKKVLFMCGENANALTQAKITANYIYKKFGVYITDAMIAHMYQLSAEQQKLIIQATADIADGGKLILVDAFHYDTIYEELVAEYERSHFDAVFIDHSMALLGKGDQYTNIGNLAVGARRFKKDYPCYVQVLSHLSVIAKDALAKGKKVENSPTKGNGTLSAEADEILILIDNEQLSKENLLGIYNYKRRNAPRILDDMVVKKKFNISSFEWSDEIQGSVTGLDIEADKAIEEINNLYDSEENDEDSDEFVYDGESELNDYDEVNNVDEFIIEPEE